MAGPSASFDGDGDAVMFDDNNDDFQLPDNFDNMVMWLQTECFHSDRCTTQTRTGKK